MPVQGMRQIVWDTKDNLKVEAIKMAACQVACLDHLCWRYLCDQLRYMYRSWLSRGINFISGHNDYHLKSVCGAERC